MACKAGRALGADVLEFGAAAGDELEEIKKFFKNLLTATQKAGHNLASLLLTTNRSNETKTQV